MSKCSFFNKTHSVRELWITVRPRSDASFHRWWRDRDIRHGRPLIPHPTGSSPYPSSSQVPRNPPTHDRGNSALVKHDIMCVEECRVCVVSVSDSDVQRCEPVIAEEVQTVSHSHIWPIRGRRAGYQQQPSSHGGWWCYSGLSWSLAGSCGYRFHRTTQTP